MKSKVKIVSLIIGIIVGLLLILLGSLWYVTKWKYTDIDTQISPDERCQLMLQMKGEPEWPFGSTYGRIIVKYDDKIINKLEFEIADDGAMLGKENWSVVWGVAGVQVTLMGSEQYNQVLQILYDGTEEFSGYNKEEVTAEMEKRYGNIKACGKEGELYCYDTGEFSFFVQNDLVMSDNYKAEYYRYLTDAYFAGRNRGYEYEENGEGVEKSYTPVISLNSSSSEEKEWFCSDIINWLLYVMKEIPYEENEELYQTIKIGYGDETFDYQFQHMHNFTEENISDVYNDLYDFVEKILTDNYEKQVTEKDDIEEETERMELTDEMIQFYLSLEPDCSYDNADGVEYRMIPVDRACGSSYYVLIATADGGESAAMVNPDPYLGSGGEAKWISFLQDGQTGFSCLTYSGGAYGKLYRTEDGGRSFETVEYPSAKVKLSDGTYYNPFVVPEKVYEKDGKLYMEAGQGADGDYYGEDGFCNGLYESEDNGKSWIYVKEIAAIPHDES
ncbi:MAG: hypothetical protein J6B68_08550 [Lachnospiraceae bacterium]|nr:hypothetical protein [Lachnospiraceae bacterium]